MDVDYLEWKNPDLDRALEDAEIAKALVLHLGDDYDGFIRTVTTIRCAIDGLQELLTSEDGNVRSIPGSTTNPRTLANLSRRTGQTQNHPNCNTD
jgi:hypothetical protein